MRSNYVRRALCCLAIVTLGIVGCSDSDEVTRPSGSSNGSNSSGQFGAAGDGGACCFDDGSCQVLLEEDCTAAGGQFQGLGTVCDPNPCPQPTPTGACCFDDGSCTVVGAEECVAGGGVYQGDDISCDPNPCPQPTPTGACCFDDGSCTVLSAEECAAGGGVYQGDDTSCDPNPCPQPAPTGACCFDDGSCTVVSAEACALGGGVYQGDDTSCDPNPCGPVSDDEGCGLGYWKNHHDSWVPTGLAPENPLVGSFAIPAELAELADDTLDDALRYPGGSGVVGGAQLLLRTAVTALLNAAHPDVDYGLTVSEITSAVNEALASLDRRTMLEVRHEIGPINGGNCPLED